ncbi:MAG: 2-hydroxyacid dehydrogenase [Lachnospiraceae bacterium]|nr:2-hydroxyacid dehydrogenase [Lachnospiraceae bacterium]
MEKVLVIGPFNETMRGALNRCLADDFELEFITSRDQYDRLTDADYIILRTLNLTAEDMEQMPKVKLIQRWGAGYDTVDIEAAAKKGIPVAVCYGVNSTPVSEMAMALILSVYRNVVPLTEGIQAGKWEREEYAKQSHTINGKTVGIVGIGNIGRKVAALCQAFGAQILYYDAYRLSPERENEMHVTYCPLDELWGKCDIISLHVPLLDSTNKMVNRDTIAKMKDGALLINSARAELVDLDALKEALVSGKLCGAGLDAVDQDVMASSPLAGIKNVVLTPHLGGNTADDAQQMAQRCSEQIHAISRGEKLTPPHVVNSNLL